MKVVEEKVEYHSHHIVMVRRDPMSTDLINRFIVLFGFIVSERFQNIENQKSFIPTKSATNLSLHYIVTIKNL